MSSSAYLPREVSLAIVAAVAIETAFFGILIFAGKNTARVVREAPPAIREIPIAVQPVMDELPLLKLGSNKKAKLPDMWNKPTPVQRYEEKSAPSAKAKKTPDAIPSSALAKPDAGPPPPPDAAVAKQVDTPVVDAGPEPKTAANGEGSPDGVKEGTETDPLKARAVDQYRARVVAWFNARFRPPKGQIDCAVLKTLNAAVQVSITGERSVASYTLTRPSGNEIFDGRVKSTLDSTIGQELPPPPPLYPDSLGSVVRVTLSGRDTKCDDTSDEKSKPQNPSSTEDKPKPEPEKPKAEEPKPTAPAEDPSP